MKKIIAIALCLVTGMLLLAGCAANGNSEPYEKKSYASKGEEISGIVIDVRDRKVEVTPSDDGNLHIDYAENSKEAFDIALSEDGILTVKIAENKELKDYIGKKASVDDRKIKVQAPQELLKSLTVSTTNEDIAVNGMGLKEKLSLNANGGNILLENVSAGKEITLTAKNGNIEGVISGSYDDFAITCTIKKGDSNLPASKESGNKKLTVNANNGDVNLEIK